MPKKFYGVFPPKPITPIQVDGDEALYPLGAIDFANRQVVIVKADGPASVPFSSIRFANEANPASEQVFCVCTYCGTAYEHIVDACPCIDEPFEYTLWLAKPLDDQEGKERSGEPAKAVRHIFGIKPVAALSAIRIKGDGGFYAPVHISWLEEKVKIARSSYSYLDEISFSKIGFQYHDSVVDIPLFQCLGCNKLHQQQVETCICDDKPFRFRRWLAKPMC